MKTDEIIFKKRTNIIFIIFYLLLCLSSITHAPHNSYTVFDLGTKAILHGIDPYPAEWVEAKDFRHWFLYSPSFALFFSIFSTLGLGIYAGGYLWMMLNFFTFWFGFASVIEILDKKHRLLQRWWYFLALFLATNELMGTLTNLQSNAFIIGLTLLGVSCYMTGRYSLSAAILAVGVNFKLLPIVVVLLLFLNFNKRFIISFIGTLALFFLLPLVFISAQFYTKILSHWISFLTTDSVHKIFLGLEPTLLSYGIDVEPKTFFIFMMLNALAIAVVTFKAFKKSPETFFQVAMPLAVVFMVIFNKRAERPSFIILTPIFIFILHEALLVWRSGDKGVAKVHALFLGTAWFLVSMSYSDLCPKGCRIFADTMHFKTLGGVLLYIWAWWQASTLLLKR